MDQTLAYIATFVPVPHRCSNPQGLWGSNADGSWVSSLSGTGCASPRGSSLSSETKVLQKVKLNDCSLINYISGWRVWQEECVLQGRGIVVVTDKPWPPCIKHQMLGIWSCFIWGKISKWYWPAGISARTWQLQHEAPMSNLYATCSG